MESVTKDVSVDAAVIDKAEEREFRQFMGASEVESHQRLTAVNKIVCSQYSH